MSIIVGVIKSGRPVIASDSEMVLGGKRISNDRVEHTKVLALGDSIVGVAGWSIYGHILADHFSSSGRPRFTDTGTVYRFILSLWSKLSTGEYGFVNSQCNDAETPFVDLDSSLLIATESDLYFVSRNLTVIRCKRYWAIGSGDEFALGALYYGYDQFNNAGEIAVAAVRAAVHFDVNCGGEPQVYEAGNLNPRGMRRTRT